MIICTVTRCGLCDRQHRGQLPLGSTDRRHSFPQERRQASSPHEDPQGVLHGHQHQLPVCRIRKSSVDKSVLSQPSAGQFLDRTGRRRDEGRCIRDPPWRCRGHYCLCTCRESTAGMDYTSFRIFYSILVLPPCHFSYTSLVTDGWA